jgi:hypothetical protein
VPAAGAIVYTIWNREGAFIYIGMSGRGVKNGQEPASTVQGPRGRLSSHAGGRRSGDQFCLYVCDRLVLPGLHNRIAEVVDGRLSLDQATKDYVRANLGFRWIAVPDSTAAFKLESRLQRGEASCGKPLLNGVSAK